MRLSFTDDVGNQESRTSRPTQRVIGKDDGSSTGPGTTIPRTGATTRAPSRPEPLQLALWTDRPGYRAGERVRLYRTLDPQDDRKRYKTFYYLERIGTGERRYFSPGIGSQELREEAVDHRGRGEGAFQAGRVERAAQALTWEGEAPAPGLWHFVLELRRQAGAEEEVRRAYAKFVAASRGQLLNRRGFDREITADLTLRSDTIYYLLHQLFVRDGATLTIEAGTLVEAWGRHAAIIVEKGGRIVAEGTREAPVVLTCTSWTGRRKAGCWGGLRVLGRAPVTRLEGAAEGVLPAERPVYGGPDAQDSSGALRYVRVEFAGAGSEPGTSTAALGLHGVGDGTALERVQAHASLGHGIAFLGGTAACDHCVSSGSGEAGLAWERGWRGAARHLYVQQGPEGVDGIAGGNDAEGHDREPRSHPALANVTLVHSSPDGARSRTAAGLRLSTGSGLTARNLLVTGFGGGAIDAGSRSALLFEEGESGVESAILHRNGYRSEQVRGGIGSGVEFKDEDPKLRNVRYEANPDPRPKSGSPALERGDDEEPPAEGEASTNDAYIGAFGEENWLEEWTFFGPESDYDVPQSDD